MLDLPAGLSLASTPPVRRPHRRCISKQLSLRGKPHRRMAPVLATGVASLRIGVEARWFFPIRSAAL
jgi:hypothetical protein